MIEMIKSRWEDILNHLKTEHELTGVSYNTWLKPIKPYSFEGTELKVLVPDKRFLSYISKKYGLLLQIAIEEVTAIECTIDFITPEQLEDSSKTNANTKAQLIERAKDVDLNIIKDSNLNPKYTFDSFVVGASNELAHAASLAVAETPGEIYNPLFIYGGVGLGKTHLMHSIGHFILKNNPNAKVLYVTSEKFTNDLIESIRNRNNFSTADFRNKYRNIDVLLIDDIQFIIGKESTQEEFFYTFNELYSAKKQIIISSDKPPKQFETLEERLRSRFECGLPVDIQSPDYETRMAILRKKEEMEGFNIDNEIMKYIATNIKSNIRELEGALTKIVALSKLNNKEITIEVAEEALKDLISPDVKHEITPELIIDVVAEHYGLTALLIASQKRTKEIVVPRQIAMFLCRSMTDYPLQAIGKCLGGRDHTTIIHGYEKIAEEMKTNDSLRNTIEILKKKINPQ